MTKPTTGRTVHYVVRTAGGELANRAAVVCEPLTTGEGYDCSLHVFLAPGDRADQRTPTAPYGTMLYVDLARRGIPGVDEASGLFGTWHWPVGTPDGRPPELQRRGGSKKRPAG